MTASQSQHPQRHVVTSSDGHLSFEITHINLLIIPCQSNFMLEILSASANLVGNGENKLQPMKTDPQYIHYISTGERRRERKKTVKGSAKSSTLIRYTIKNHKLLPNMQPLALPPSPFPPPPPKVHSVLTWNGILLSLNSC